MKTLIELYDDRPIENVLSVDLFRPEKVVYICPHPIAEYKRLWNSMAFFFSTRGIESSISVQGARVFDTEEMLKIFRKITAENPDCVLDITGGSDASLFAAGLFCEESDIPVFTYSRRKNRFFNIRGAEFVEDIQVDLKYSAEDFFRMAGTDIEKGRTSEAALEKHLNQIEDFFHIFMRYRKKWKKAVVWFQKAAPASENRDELGVRSRYTLKGESRGTVSANEPLLRDLEGLGFIHNLKIESGKTVDFSFDDAQTRFWLRDTGSVLELYTWKACLDAGIFNDLRCSTIIRWDDSGSNSNTDSYDVNEKLRIQGETVTNEIDVFASRGIIPVFISCKVCAIDTDALNELAILKNRFGGEMAKACIVSTEDTRAITVSRAAALGLDVVELDDIQNGSLAERFRAMYSRPRF